MNLSERSKLRTRIYVDGYNLYYGCLRKTSFKWLDLQALFTQVLSQVFIEHEGGPAESQLDANSIQYFTASILKNFARADDSVACQAAYHNALRGHLAQAVTIIEGYYAAEAARAHLYEKGKPARDCERVEIWKLVEKQSDVALALHAYSDAIRGEVDQVVLVTNDTDVVPCMDLIRSHTSVKIGLIVPTRDCQRQVNTDLSLRANWTRSHLLDEELLASQMPNMVKLGTQPIHKPTSWYPRPDRKQFVSRRVEAPH
jgi:6-hydroxy-3-succinoylpyridine 3-monooxygenase